MNQSDMFGDANGKTLVQARREFFEEAEVRSTSCPCCDKHGKVYHRKFNSCMATTMIHTYKFFVRYPAEFLDVAHYMLKQLPDWVPSDYGKLVWWELMERSPDPTDGKNKSNGLFRMTPKGRAFVEGRITVPSHAVEYRSIVREFEGDQVDISTALGRPFNYRELMEDNGR